MLKEEKRDYHLDEDAIKRLYCLHRSNAEQVKVWNVFRNGDLAGGLLWLFDGHRITYLVPLSGEGGKELNIPTFIINELIKQFKNVDSLYVADGHHRTAAAALVGKERKDTNPGHNGKEEYNYFLAVHFPDNQLTINSSSSAPSTEIE